MLITARLILGIPKGRSSEARKMSGSMSGRLGG